MTYSPRVNLYETDVTNITEIMAGPWKAIKVVDAASGETVVSKNSCGVVS